MELILNAGFGVGILMLFVLLFKQRKIISDYFFLFWIVAILCQIAFYEITIYLFELNGLVAIVGFAIPLLSGPLLFLYIQLLTGKKVSPLNTAIHLSVFVGYVGFLFLFQKYTDIIIIATNGYLIIDSGNSKLIDYYYAIPLAVSGMIYGIYGLYLLKQHRRRIVAILSFDENINLGWIQYMIYSFFAIVLVLVFLIFGATHFKLFKLDDVFAFVGITLSIMLGAFGFYGFRQTEVFSNFKIVKKEQEPNMDELIDRTSSYTKSGLTEEKIKYHAQRLTEYMELEKPFLSEDLTLPVLAKQCNLSYTQLSQIINQYFQINFYDFVNQYRVKESKKMLGSPDFDHLSILGIAYDCGFKSKSSFNRYFKKLTGLNPSEFKKKKS